MTRTLGFLVFPRFQMLDLTGPLTAFQMANSLAGEPGYAPRLVSEAGGAMVSTAGLEVPTTPLRAGTVFDTLIVVGGVGARTGTPSPAFLDGIRAAAGKARRVASVCTGAFLLAAAGLLDGRRATTHWRHAVLLQQRHPMVQVDGDRIYVEDGRIWTSAGITAGIDLALALIEADLGADLAQAVAREMVVPYRRAGGQSQFSVLKDFAPDSDRIRDALAHARAHLAEPLPVERLAAAARLSPRQFGRLFRAETGETPARAVERLRAEAARARLEGGREPVEAIATATGFVDPERMRRAFLRLYGLPPRELRRNAERIGREIGGQVG